MKKSDGFRDLYKPVPHLKDDGKMGFNYAYIGDYYSFDMNKSKLKRFKLINGLLTLIFLLMYVCMGFINNEGFNKPYVVGCYLLVALALLLVMLGVLELLLNGPLYNESEHQRAILRTKYGLSALTATWAITLVADIVFIFVESPDPLLGDIIFSALAAICIVGSYFCVSFFGKAKILHLSNDGKTIVEEKMSIANNGNIW